MAIDPQAPDGYGASDIDDDLDEAFRELVFNHSLGDASEPNLVVDLLRQHLGIDPVTAAQAGDVYEGMWCFPAFQAGLDAYLDEPGRTHELIGVLCPLPSTGEVVATLSRLFTPASLSWPGANLGPVTWDQVASGYDRSMRCLSNGLLLVDDAEGPVAIWITNSRPAANSPARNVMVAAEDPDRAAWVIAELRRLSVVHSPYRGQMFIPWWPVKFLPRPAPLTSDDLILPPGLLDRIDKHALGIGIGRERLIHSGQHLKRGLLLYGPPGTGKTHTIRYLASRLPEDTTIVIAPPEKGPGMRLHAVEMFLPLIGDSPAMIVLDDVDDIAESRVQPGARGELFHLLDFLDGLYSHGDILFVLTTNRLDVLESAIAARPGRIDEILEVGRPDEDCRRRLFDRYRQGMTLDITDAEIDEVIHRTNGVTGSFTKELLRRATLVAVENGSRRAADGSWPVKGRDVLGALDEMLDPANPLTRALLGGELDHAPRTTVVSS